MRFTDDDHNFGWAERNQLRSFCHAAGDFESWGFNLTSM
tara:strand:+ start:305 stop:421 length:117 start_codon:yes stop_codon:yes gene_type:complete